MPELPEVETFARQIRPLVLNKLIKNLHVSPKGLCMISPGNQAELEKFLLGKQFNQIARHGKFLIFCLEKDQSIVAHLRMSGRFTVTSGKPDSSDYNRLHIEFADGSFLNFLDTRRFGTFHIVNGGDYPGLKRLGKDALDSSWSDTLFKQTLEKHNKIIYRALLDQSIIAGIGNIYANESLFRSSINPLRSSKSLSQNEVAALLKNISSILFTALEFKGTTLIDNSYVDLEGNSGEFRNLLQVYGRENKLCIICNQPIKRMRISNRSVYYCAVCQKE